MNWEAIGSIAELVGGIGVVASLLYLGVQIRQNTRSLRAATYESLAGATSASNSLLMTDPDLARIVRTGFAGQERLSEDDYARFDSYLRMTFRRYDSVLFHHRQGTLTDEAWTAYWNSFRKALASPGVQTAWRRHADEYTTSFQAVVAVEIASLPDEPTAG